MQMQIPLFPEHTKMINGSLGFFMKDKIVFYLHNGSPIYCHNKEDMDNFRFVMANLVEMDLCTAGELSTALGIPHRNVNRYTKKLKTKGTGSFFQKEDRRGKCYQLTEEKKLIAQELLNKGTSNVKTAKELGISESAIRYHLKQGNLHKKK